MLFEAKDLPKKKLKELYLSMLKPRLIEERMLILLRQNKISKWFSGIGQEATSVGVAAATDPDEYILPMHRNLGVFTCRNVSLVKLFNQFQGRVDGFTKGRDRSFHFGTKDHHIVGMISHLGPQLGIADGIALAKKLKKERKATVVFTGDGGTSEGDFHEALNVAAVWDLPVLFVIENNGYGLSTPNHEQFKGESLAVRGEGYGIESLTVDGNNILEVYTTVKEKIESIRLNPRPILVECFTFRMRGHEEASGTKYVPKEVMDHWSKKDPVINFENFLVDEKVYSKEEVSAVRDDLESEIISSVKKSFSDSEIPVNSDAEISDVFYPYSQKVIHPLEKSISERRSVDAVSDALRQSMNKYKDLIIMGQDISDYGGVFKVTEGFVEEFGRDRVRNTPLCESAIIGTALGLSIDGIKSVVEMQFADFVTCGFNQIVNNLAKIHYRWGQNADVVVRMPTGGGVSAGPFHSQSNEAWFFHTPGLKIVYPSCAADAKGLLNAAIEDPNPYLFFEHKALYRSNKENIYDDYYTSEVGKAKIISAGSDLTIITYGMGVHWALDIAKKFTDHSIEIVDLRTLQPWDKETVKESVEKTNKTIIIHEDTITGGIGAEISAWITENCFSSLDGPVLRVGGLDTPVPFRKELEENFMPSSRIEEKINMLLRY
ncbi:MAG: dehydrogenase E1 component subunit alpha/beta [Bacteroidota bacterium]|nr:dehydrogenase E1 component subunit alpha/beta [Bacteroidota bacterium]